MPSNNNKRFNNKKSTYSRNNNNNNNKKRKSYKKNDKMVHSLKTILYAMGTGFILFGLLSKKLINIVVDTDTISKMLPKDDNASTLELRLTNYINKEIKTQYIEPLFEEENSFIIDKINGIEELTPNQKNSINQNLEAELPNIIDTFKIDIESFKDTKIQLGASLFGVLLNVNLQSKINKNDNIININEKAVHYFFKDIKLGSNYKSIQTEIGSSLFKVMKLVLLLLIGKENYNNSNNSNDNDDDYIIELIESVGIVIEDATKNTLKKYDIKTNDGGLIPTLLTKLNTIINKVSEKTLPDEIKNEIATTLKTYIKDSIKSILEYMPSIPTLNNSLTNTITSSEEDESFINNFNNNVGGNSNNSNNGTNTKKFFIILFVILVFLLGLFLILKIFAEPHIGNKIAYKIIVSIFIIPVQVLLFLISIILIIVYNKNLVKKTFGSLLPIDIEDKNDNNQDKVDLYHNVLKLNPTVILFLIGTVIFMLFNLYKTGISFILLGILLSLVPKFNSQIYIPKSLNYGILPIVGGIILIIGKSLINKTKK